MFYVLQNDSTAARRRVPILLTDAATGTTAQSGVALTTIFPYVNINGGAFIGGTGSLGEADFGQYYYEMEINETATLGLAGIHITAAGCRNYDAIAQISAFNMYSNTGLGLTAGDVWSYVLSDSNTADANLVSAAAGGGGVTAGDVWSYVLSNSSTADANLSSVSNNVDIQSSTIPQGVWNVNLGSNVGNEAGNLIYLAGNGLTGYVNAASDVWSYATRTLTSGGGITAGDIWDYDLSAYNTLGNSAGSYLFFNTDKIFSNLDIPSSAIAASTWSYVTRTLTSAATGLTAGDVWTYGTRTITGGLADTVTTVTNRSGFAITGGTITTVLDKTGYSLSGTQSFNLTGNITGNVSGSVGSVTAPVTIATVSMTGIAGTVWNSLIATYGTNGTFGKLVLRSDAANKTGDVTLYSSGGVNGVDADVHRIANDTAAATVWKEVLTGIGGSITANIRGSVSGSVGSVTGSVGSVVSPVSVASASMTGIAGTVWSTNISGYTTGTAGNALLNAGGGGVAVTAGDIWTYFDRTLTSSTGATAGDVWTYNTRTLTSGAGITVIGAVQLVNGPYRLTSNQNNNDGILDILQNSVQEINLNLIDGNGAPASTAGYATVVNFFNEAGTAVTSYVPVIEYADGGVLTFEIDGAVTSTTGRYNLIVNLSGAGFLVKYGPLTTLVRPL